MKATLPASWRRALAGEQEKDYFKALERFLDEERAAHQVFPAEGDVFRALALTPFERVSVLLLGQDPYHGEGQAHGLCFSVPSGTRPPPSLVNVFKELQSDLGLPVPAHGNLVKWAKQGVLLLNAVLTVRAREPASHKGRGWEIFTDAVIRALAGRPTPLVFALWGGHAQKKASLIDPHRHRIVIGAHPSPLSVKKFRGSKPFSAINKALAELGRPPIDWRLPD